MFTKKWKKLAFLVENSDTDKVDDTEGVNIVLTTEEFHKTEILLLKYLNVPAHRQLQVKNVSKNVKRI